MKYNLFIKLYGVREMYFLKLLNNTPNFYHGTYDCEEAQSVIDGGLIPDQPYNSWTLALDYTYTNMLKGW